MSQDVPLRTHGERVERYERRTAVALITASLLYLAAYAAQVLWLGAPAGVLDALIVVENLIWAVFIVDFLVRIYLADRRWRYVGAHPVDVITILLPMFRPLRALRVFASVRILIERGQHIKFGRVATAITLAAAFIGFVGALIELDLERNAPDSNITTFGQALWWAAVTMSTVGYGDAYPVTGPGQMAAVAMLIVGISLLGAVTATFASWVSEHIATRQQKSDDVLLAELRALRAEVTGLRAEQEALRRAVGGPDSSQ